MLLENLTLKFDIVIGVGGKGSLRTMGLKQKVSKCINSTKT